MDGYRIVDTKFQKGSAGRPPGALNKTTVLLKDAILEAAKAAGGGGPEGLAKYLKRQSEKSPGAFMVLLGKVLPTQVSGADGAPITLTFAKEDEKLL